MIAGRAYRVVLYLLPAELRRKHGAAMETLFARELEHARTHGVVRVAIAAVGGVGDVVLRSAYEVVRPARGTHMSVPPAPLPTTRQLLRGHAVAFLFAFVMSTAALLFLYGRRLIPKLMEQGASLGTIVEALLLSVPFTAAITIPMAVLLAVLSQFTGIGANGTLAAVRRSRAGVRALVLPVLTAACGVALFAFVLTAEIVPRTNAQLESRLSSGAGGGSERSMTIGALRAAVQNVRPGDERVARVSVLQVEVQKKLALPAACAVLALVGMAITFCIPRGGSPLVVGAGLTVFGAYYVMLMGGEALADRQVISPLVAMWGANVVFMTIALLMVWPRASQSTPSAPAPVGTE